MPNVLDEFTHEALAIRIDRELNSTDVIDVLTDLFILRGTPEHVRSDTLAEARIIVESWRRHYNSVRPHESLGHRPPAPEVFVPAFAAWRAALAQRPPMH